MINMKIKNCASQEGFFVQFSTRVIIDDPETGDVYVDKSNAIHSQNMARAIARGLANEPNGIIYRMAFGNGGSFTDAAENIRLNPPNDGTRGEGWESRLYNETYSEIVQEFLVNQSAGGSIVPNTDIGTDPGSVGPANIRFGGGALPEEDSPSNSVMSLEVGRRSNIIATVTLNRNEPVTQLPETTGPGSVINPTETTFNFDELGLYTPGKGASATPAFVRIPVNTRNSDSLLGPTVPRNTSLSMNMIINGVNTFTSIVIPADGVGSGPTGEITYGDLCQNFNEGNTDWLVSGADISDEVEMLITNRSTQNTYASIIGAETAGDLIIRTKTTGDSSTLEIECGTNSIFYQFNECIGIQTFNGESAGIINDPTNQGDNERERLLTHLTFPPILKAANREIRIRYILTVSVAQVGDTVTDIQDPTTIT